MELWIGWFEGGPLLWGFFVVFCVRGVWKTYIISFGIANMQDMLGAILCRSSMLVLLGKGTFMQQSRNFSTIQHLERDRFLWFVGGVCCDLRSLGEWKDRVFRGRDKEPCEVWFLVRFLMSHGDLVLKIFFNYSIGNILLSWSPLFGWSVLVVLKAMTKK